MIYLDNAATTKMDESLIEVYKSFSCDKFYNASAGYSVALENAKHLAKAKEILLNKLGAKVGDIIFTGCATESNNIALQGSVKEGKWEYIFSKGEHPSVYNIAKMLEEQGKTIHFLDLQKNGEIDYVQLESLVNDKTRLVSTMFVSNETGAINDLERIVKIVKAKNPRTLIHVDGVQGFCKTPINISKLNIDFFSISAHKFHGPKGVGALYVKNKSLLRPIIFGGGQEYNLRSGTENLPGIMAMVTECEKIDVAKNLKHVKELRDVFLNQLDLNKVHFISSGSPYVISLNFPGVNGETLMRALEDKVIIGTGSACSTKKAGNRVLEAMGYSKEYAKQSVRVSFNAYQSVEEVEKAGKIIMETYLDLYERLKWK